MKLIGKYILALSAFLLVSCNIPGIDNDKLVNYKDDKTESNKQFDYDGNYVPPELVIDGLNTDEQWKNATSKLTFGATNSASMVMYRGENSLFCYFEVKDIDIQTVGFNNGDDVTLGDSVEVYFDFKNDASNKPVSDDIQINIGAHGKTRIFVGSNGDWGSWNGLLDYEIVLNGTLNDDSDEDVGYSVELMIPYSQIGIDKNSTFGVSVGHVSRGLDSTHEFLNYTWGGLFFEGNFVDPQSPRTYVLCKNNSFFSRSDLPIGIIDIDGKVLDENGNAVSNAKIKINDEEIETDENGTYWISQVNGDDISKITVSKDGYQTYERKISRKDLANKGKLVSVDLCLISNNSNKKVKISGLVQNLNEGIINNARVLIADQVTVSDSEGKFNIETKIAYDLVANVSKDGYKGSLTTIDPLALIKNNNYDIGILNLYSPSSFTSFGGQRNITKVDVEIYRGVDGINFDFKADKEVSEGDQIEVFMDTLDSFKGRDTSDYRIAFRSDESLSIVNFGNGTNTLVSSSGITNEAHYENGYYYIKAFIPYSFLNVNYNDIIGITFGMWSETLNDWDGWSYEAPGFDDYVAPEYTNEYCRVGLDNSLYRSSSNYNIVAKVFGKVVDSNNNIIANAKVNNVKVKEDGSFTLYFNPEHDAQIEVTANGYEDKTIVINVDELLTGNVYKEIVLTEIFARVEGTCNAEGAKVYVEDNPSNYVYVTNGKYSLLVPTKANVYVVFECEGYKTVRFGIGVVTLMQCASNDMPYTRNVTMERI